MQPPDPSFRATRFREGYHVEDVDAFLDEVLPQLRSGRLASDLEDRLVAVTFRPTKFRDGYDQDDVDDYLDLLVRSVRQLRSRREPDPAGRGEGASVPAAGAAPERPVFTRTRWREGYDVEDVDRFVAEVLALLRDGPVPVGLPDRVVNATFEPTRLRDGYAQDEVDDYLDVLAAAATHAVRHARSVPLTAAEAAAQAEALARPGRGPDGARFPLAGRLVSGYRIDEVDALARRIARELPTGRPVLTADEIGATRFGRRRAGYRTDLVDGWLADVEGHLRRLGP